MALDIKFLKKKQQINLLTTKSLSLTLSQYFPISLYFSVNDIIETKLQRIIKTHLR